MKPMLIISILVQAVAVVVVVFVPFGFDHPSSWGLDFDDFVAVGAVYSVALVMGMTSAIVERRFGLVGVQVLVPIVIVFLGTIGFLHI